VVLAIVFTVQATLKMSKMMMMMTMMMMLYGSDCWPINKTVTVFIAGPSFLILTVSPFNFTISLNDFLVACQCRMSALSPSQTTFAVSGSFTVVSMLVCLK